MPLRVIKIDTEEFSIELDEVLETYFFPEKGVSLPARLVSGFYTGITQPITVVLPTAEFTEEKLIEEVKKKVKFIREAMKPL